MSQVIVYTHPENGNCAVCHPNLDCGLTIEEIQAKDCPNNSYIIEDNELPHTSDDPLFNSWRVNNGKVDIDIDHAKQMAHEKRRVVRDQEFEPLDRQATNPALLNEVEVQRQAIRDKYAVIQTDIDNASDAASLRSIVEGL